MVFNTDCIGCGVRSHILCWWSTPHVSNSVKDHDMQRGSIEGPSGNLLSKVTLRTEPCLSWKRVEGRHTLAEVNASSDRVVKSTRPWRDGSSSIASCSGMASSFFLRRRTLPCRNSSEARVLRNTSKSANLAGLKRTVRGRLEGTHIKPGRRPVVVSRPLCQRDGRISGLERLFLTLFACSSPRGEGDGGRRHQHGLHFL